MAKARILIVDDEPNVLEFVARVLERVGYETVTASGPLEALDLVTTRGFFDLVVSDVIMPEMCGPQLAKEIRHASPSSAIMFMSGCVPVGELPKAVPYIGKPFTASALLGAVDRVVGARP